MTKKLLLNPFSGKFDYIDVYDDSALPTTYEKLDGTNQPATGNKNVSKADPELRLTDTGNSEYSRWTKSDTSNMATLFNRVTKPGSPGKAVSFDGSTAYITIPPLAVDDDNARSISLWAFVDTTASGINTFISWGLPGASIEFGIYFNILSTDDIYIACNANDVHSSGSIMTKNAWHHIVLTYAGGGMTPTNTKLYVDGVNKTLTQVGGGGALATGNGTIFIGRYAHSASYYHKGYIDEVNIWDRALTLAEVGDLYNGGLGLYLNPASTFPSTGTPVKTNLKAIYHLDEGTGTNTDDSGVNFFRPMGDRTGNAIKITGTNKYVEAATSTGIDLTTAMTTSFWIYPLAYNADNEGIVAKFSKPTAGSSPADQEWIIGMLIPNHHIIMHWRNSGLDHWWSDSEGTTAIQLNTWYHVVITHDVSATKIYINGSLEVTATGGTINLTDNSIWVGAFQWGAGSYYPFNGKIDEVKIYNVVKDQTWVTADYNLGAGVRGSNAETNMQIGYHFDEETGNSGDYSNNSHTGTLTNAPTYDSGKITIPGTILNNVLANDFGVNYLDYDIAKDISVEAWFYWDGGTNSYETIVSKYNNYSSESTFTYTLRINNLLSTVEWYVYPTGTSYNRAYFNIAGNVSAKKWYHIVGTYDGRYSKIYLNGTLMNTNDFGADRNLSNSSAPIRVGLGYSSTPPNGAEPWGGLIDEVRIYSKALSQAEVIAHYNYGAGIEGSPEANLEIGYHFNETSGSTVADYSGNARNATVNSISGTLTGGTGWVNGKITTADSTVETTILTSQNGGVSGEEGIQTFGTATGRSIIEGLTTRLNNAGTEVGNISSTGFYVGDSTAATARLHLKAGSATAGTAPLKLTSGALLSSAEAGAIEFLTDDYYATITTGTAREKICLTAGLTVTRIPYATTNGRLTDSATITTDGTTITAGGFTTTGTIHAHGYSVNTTTQTGSTYNILTSDDVIICNSASITVTLPTAVGAQGKTYTIKNINTGSVTINTTSSQTIDDSLTQTIVTQYTSISVISDNANWFII